ncbi:unnamed protein product [Prorocentrum cordatum]|uniref:Uncharacterized protein n=1 Tax=Prorocentrum cordatum TaxID=2364126 RepID=A0ABN9PXY3_9DINO|nr:unnamed protein product [Polarella glacialis]
MYTNPCRLVARCCTLAVVADALSLAPLDRALGQATRADGTPAGTAPPPARPPTASDGHGHAESAWSALLASGRRLLLEGPARRPPGWARLGAPAAAALLAAALASGQLCREPAARGEGGHAGGAPPRQGPEAARPVSFLCCQPRPEAVAARLQAAAEPGARRGSGAGPGEPAAGARRHARGAASWGAAAAQARHA